MAMASPVQRSPSFNHINKQTEKEKEKDPLGSNVLSFPSSKNDLNLEATPKVEFDDRYALLNLIKSCGKEKNFMKARNLHVELMKKKLIPKDVYVTTALLNTYAKCGSMKEAQYLFNEIPVHNVVTWTTLIGGYVRLGFGHEALKCFSQMQSDHVQPDNITYICILKACGLVGSIEMGEKIEAIVRKQGLLSCDLVLGNALIDMYAKCGSLSKARDIFDWLPLRDVVSWNTLIVGYSHVGLSHEALKCFVRMQKERARPDVVTFTSVLKVCGSIGAIEIGEEINVEVRKQGLIRKEVVVGTSLIDMYAKCGVLEKAREVLELLPMRDVVSWTALISGYTEHGCGYEALKCFEEMQNEGISPDAITYVCVLKACGIVGSIEIGKKIDAEVTIQGLLAKNVVLGNALVDMYAKCDALQKAKDVFEKLSVRDVVTWNSLLAGYAQHKLSEEALNCFRLMQDEGVHPDEVTYICVLKACSIVGSLETGEGINVDIRKQGLLQNDMVLGNALLDMYVKCGVLQKAQEVFEQLPLQDVVSWNTLMSGYAQLGQANIVLNLWRKLLAEGIVPNTVTFLVSLTACSHAGLLSEGEKLFDNMSATCDLVPTLQHYTCMIDLFVRAGHFDRANILLDKVSASDHLPLFLAILGACQKWVNVKLGRWAFEQSIQLDETCGASYVCMENIYAAAGMQIEANEIEAWRVKNKAWKMPSCWIDANRNCTFV